MKDNMTDELYIDPIEYADWLKNNNNELTAQDIAQLSAEFENS